MAVLSRVHSNHQAVQPAVSTNGSIAAKVAIPVIKALGAILMAAGACCAVMALYLPATVLLATGAITLGVSFICGRGEITRVNQQNTTSVVPAAPVATPRMAFGKEDWIQYLGVDPGNVPSLPANIQALLDAPCPFWPGKKVADTHMLVLVPKEVTKVVGGVRRVILLTLKNLNELFKAANNGTGVAFSEYSSSDVFKEIGDEPIKESHWILMTKDAVPRTRGERYYEQTQLLKKAKCQAPSCIQAAVAILSEYLKTGNRVFSNSIPGANFPNAHDPERVYTRCQDHARGTNVLVGDFQEGNGGLGIYAAERLYGNVHDGMAGVMIL